MVTDIIFFVVRCDDMNGVELKRVQGSFHFLWRININKQLVKRNAVDQLVAFESAIRSHDTPRSGTALYRLDINTWKNFAIVASPARIFAHHWLEAALLGIMEV